MAKKAQAERERRVANASSAAYMVATAGQVLNHLHNEAARDGDEALFERMSAALRTLPGYYHGVFGFIEKPPLPDVAGIMQCLAICETMEDRPRLVETAVLALGGALKALGVNAETFDAKAGFTAPMLTWDRRGEASA